MRAPRTIWTSTQDRRLLTHREAGTPDKVIAAEFGLSIDAIRSRSRRLGISRPERKVDPVPALVEEALDEFRAERLRVLRLRLMHAVRERHQVKWQVVK